MKLKTSFFMTLRQDVKDEDSVSSNLLVRSGMIKKNSSGIYMILPLGYKVLNNIENVIRKHMNLIESQELMMPSLIHEDYYEKSGRIKNFGSSVFTLKDRFDKKYVLGPTHEELFAFLASFKVKSYKDLPFSLYQFQTKYRDEARPRYGLIRVREFIMKDAYSFDTDLEGLDKSYNKMYQAYIDIFNELKLNYRIVKADTGVMGGLLSEEFQAVTSIGEDTLVICDTCKYASNLEIAETIFKEVKPKESNIQKIYTPQVKTIEQLTSVLGKNNYAKTLIYKIEDKLVMIVIDGRYEVNQLKLEKLYKTENISLASYEEVKSLNSCLGYVGPINLNIETIVDKSILSFDSFICGANLEDYHLTGVTINDLSNYQIVDVLTVKEEDLCPCCNGKLKFTKGIEIGNTFKLGTKYSKCFNLNYAASDGKLQPVVMGSYGIGIGRLMASIAEQNHDEEGLIWPEEIAPYQVAIVIANINDEVQKNKALMLYEYYQTKNVDVILDDRDERFGVKLNDMTLIGIPKIIIVGKNAYEDKVEIKLRTSNIKEEITIKDLLIK